MPGARPLLQMISRSWCGRCGSIVATGVAILAMAAMGGRVTTSGGMLLADEQPSWRQGIAFEAIRDELAELTRSLVSQTASAESSAQNRRSIIRTASLVALLGQALAEFSSGSALPLPEKESAKQTPPLIQPQRGQEIRQIAQQLARAETYEKVVKLTTRLQEIVNGSVEAEASLPLSDDWSGMIGLPAAMSELNGRATLYRRALRRPADPRAESRLPLMMALLGQAIHAEKDWVTKPEDLAQWEQLSQQMTQHFGRSSQARQKENLPLAREAFAEAMQLCQQCHDKFKN